MLEGPKVYVELRTPIADYGEATEAAEREAIEDGIFDDQAVRCVSEAYHYEGARYI